jgi:hypothetical protein
VGRAGALSPSPGASSTNSGSSAYASRSNRFAGLLLFAGFLVIGLSSA